MRLPKFQFGQPVFLMNSNGTVCCGAIIMAIAYDYVFSKENNEIYHYSFDFMPLASSAKEAKWFSENKLFPTKEELIASL